MTDILKSLSVDVHCDQCGDFTVPADVIAQSQRLLAKGCPGSTFECPPTLFAMLLPRSVLESLERAWAAVESAARSPVQHVRVADTASVNEMVSSRDFALTGTDAGKQPEARAIARWEDDGGYVPSGGKSTRAAPRPTARGREEET